MTDHIREQVTNILKDAIEQGDIKARATAFSLMKGILENGTPALSQVRELEEIIYIWNSLETS